MWGGGKPPLRSPLWFEVAMRRETRQGASNFSVFGPLSANLRGGLWVSSKSMLQLCLGLLNYYVGQSIYLALFEGSS